MIQSPADDELDPLPGVLENWSHIVAGAVADFVPGVAAELALRAGREAVMRLSEEYGGASAHTYLNKAQSIRLDARDREILAKFNGRNFTALGLEYRLSDRHIRRLVKRAEAIEKARRQDDMFPGRELPDRR